MYKNLKFISLMVAIYLMLPKLLNAQASTQMSNRFYRVAEIGQLADSINVWGDVRSSGRYLVPKGTNLAELISYAFGVTQIRGRESDIDWAKTQLEVKVSRYKKQKNVVDIALFKYKMEAPEPSEMFDLNLQNNDIVTLQVKRKPSFTDYLRVIAPTISLLTTSILLVQNLTGN